MTAPSVAAFAAAFLVENLAAAERNLIFADEALEAASLVRDRALRLVRRGIVTTKIKNQRDYEIASAVVIEMANIHLKLVIAFMEAEALKDRQTARWADTAAAAVSK